MQDHLQESVDEVAHPGPPGYPYNAAAINTVEVHVEDWDLDQQRRPATTRPLQPSGVLLTVIVIVLLAVAVGTVLRQSRPESPFAVPAATGMARPQRASDDPKADPGRDAAVGQAAEILLGDALYAGDPNALNLSPAQTLVLRNRDTEVQVTPGPVTAGTNTCAAGPLLTVAMSIRAMRGSADLTLGDFTLLGRDSSMTHPVEACSTGFVEAAQERTIVFAAAQPGRLSYGPDPGHPVAMWHLTLTAITPPNTG